MKKTDSFNRRCEANPLATQKLGLQSIPIYRFQSQMRSQSSGDIESVMDASYRH